MSTFRGCEALCFVLSHIDETAVKINEANGKELYLKGLKDYR